jgi:hypothetical protein
MDIEEQEIDIDNLVNVVFNNSPKEPKSIRLDIDVDNTEELFGFMVEFFTKGMKHKFANEDGKVELDELYSEDLEDMDKYFQSIGIKLYYDRTLKSTGEEYKTYKDEDLEQELSNKYFSLNCTCAQYKFYFKII